MKFSVFVDAVVILARPICSALGGFVEQLEVVKAVFSNDAEAGKMLSALLMLVYGQPPLMHCHRGRY